MAVTLTSVKNIITLRKWHSLALSVQPIVQCSSKTLTSLANSSEFPPNTSEPTLTSWDGRVPRVVAQRRAAAGCCGVADEAVTTVAGPAHHAVNVTTALRRDGAVERRVRGGAVQSCHRANRIISATFNKVASNCNKRAKRHIYASQLMAKTSLHLFGRPQR